MNDLVLRSGRLWGRTGTEDVVVRDGRIAGILTPGDRIPGAGPGTTPPATGESGAGESGAREIDAGDRIVLPGLINAHCHIDKTIWGGPWVPNTAGTELHGMIGNGRRRRAELGIPHEGRMAGLLADMAAAGTTHVRTHTDVDPDIGLSGVEAVMAAAERVAGSLTVEQVAFPQSGLLVEGDTVELMEAALRMGVQTIGGLDPAGVDGDPVAHLDVVFGLAEKHGAKVDIHLHDGGTLGLWQVGLIAERTKALSLQGRVAISHAFAIGEEPRPQQERIADLLAGAGMALFTCAGFSDPIPSPAVMRAAGVPMGLGTDGIRDLWSPYGSADMLVRVGQLAVRSGFKSEEEIELALWTATEGAAAALGLEEYGLRVGAPADFTVVDGASAAHAVVEHAPRRHVVKAGLPLAL
ncbi:amidohydrolase [Streptomyces sp. NPDC058326]|uniref:amidohydrolase n=1 Tax=Streptomyces sp. NPDC058326 TaxID=3346447 RepID=UPI0036E50B21